MDIKDIIKDEYKKCAQDPVYFFKKYGYIQHPQRGRLLFILYRFQERVLQQLRDNDYNIILKSRQLGISTLTAAYALWMMLFHPDKNILVIATKQDIAKNIVQKVRYMFDNLPSWLKVECTESNKLSIRFSNGSQIKAESSAASSGRSEAVSMLIIDEAAFIENVEEIWGSAQQTLATGGKAIILSTPNGIGNWFHKKWQEAVSEGTMNTIQLHWSMHPERNQAWRDDQDKILGPRLATQECDANFITSGATVVPPEILEFYKQNFVSEPIEKRGFNKDLWIWKLPETGKNYLVCSDVARGDASDKSSFHVIELESLEQVAEYDGLISTKEYGNLLVAIATEYNDALLAVENANIGWAAIQQVIDRQYKNLYYTETDLKYIDAEHQYSNKYYSRDRKKVAGFTTSLKVRPLMVSKLEAYFRDRLVMIHSARMIEQLYTFNYYDDKAKAAPGYNDDLCLALCIGLWIRDVALRRQSENNAIQRSMLNAFTVNKGSSQYVVDSIYMGNASTQQEKLANQSWQMELPSGEIENLKDWIDPIYRK